MGDYRSKVNINDSPNQPLFLRYENPNLNDQLLSKVTLTCLSDKKKKKSHRLDGSDNYPFQQLRIFREFSLNSNFFKGNYSTSCKVCFSSNNDSFQRFLGPVLAREVKLKTSVDIIRVSNLFVVL